MDEARHRAVVVLAERVVAAGVEAAEQAIHVVAHRPMHLDELVVAGLLEEHLGHLPW